jgi:hypothetical protein
LVPASAEEEQPQCSSPIALSPWGEPSYYQGEAVDSALWGVQDGNDMWSMPSPTPGLQPSSGLRCSSFSVFASLNNFLTLQNLLHALELMEKTLHAS